MEDPHKTLILDGVQCCRVDCVSSRRVNPPYVYKEVTKRVYFVLKIPIFTRGGEVDYCNTNVNYRMICFMLRYIKIVLSCAINLLKEGNSQGCICAVFTVTTKI